MDEETLQKTFGKTAQVAEVSLKGSKAYIVSFVPGPI
jgi:hypothetical protein